jgi:hypothetical protein
MWQQYTLLLTYVLEIVSKNNVVFCFEPSVRYNEH